MSLRGFTFRASPLYELVSLERLAPEERAALLEKADLHDDAYGVLRPRPGAQRAVREVSPDLALLFLSLAEQGPLPSFAVQRLGDGLDDTIAKLVLDGVLELEQDGAFVSGPEAADAVGLLAADGGTGRIRELSLAAVRYGEALRDLPVDALALRLYFYGRTPISPARERALARDGALDAFLGLPEAARGWSESPDDAASPWRMWRQNGRPAGGERSAGYKLYVSASLDALPRVLPAVAETLAPVRGATGFKLARDVRGLCRPDKLVAYFTRLEDLRDAASVLGQRLEGCHAQGVPFTADISADGLLSWGLDPPSAGRSPSEPKSWRLWIAVRLAEHLVEAREQGVPGREPWRFALERLRLDGVDTDTWIPNSRLWHEEQAVA